MQLNAAALAGSTASGVVPSGLPARLLVGLFEDSGQTWMKNSGARWDARYRYFTKGWINNWGYSAKDGSWGLAYLKESDQQGYLPAIQYYQLVGEAGGGESATLQKLQNASTMASYFGDFKILMQRVKDFGKPTLVLLEADAVGFLEQQSADNPNAYAAIAASGMPELSTLPNTVAGFGLAYLKLKQAVGASNAIIGLHVSAWASGKDVASYNVSDALGPEVDKVYRFLAPLGLGANSTGTQYDVLVGDPLDRDADYYRTVQGSDRTWDASDSASINSRSFNRYAEWLRLWNQKASKRWLLWQIPLGNSNHKNVWNNGGSAEGYKDNRPEYFFANGTAHLQKFAESGVIGVLFGAGTSGQSSYQNDTYSDGQLFMKSRAGAVLNAGGVPIAPGSGTPPPACTPLTGTGTGLRGEYFTSTGLTGSALVRTDANVDFSWASAAPSPALPADGFSTRWTGQVSPRFTGPTTFYTVSDDGVRLWVNGQLLIDNWTNHGTTENSASLTLNAGQKYDLKLEYYEATGGATARLLWSSSCETKQAIASSQLYAANTGDGAQYAFESSTQGWQGSGSLTSVTNSSERAFSGSGSLKVNLSGSGTATVKVASPSVSPGKSVSFHVWLPSGSVVSAIQPYIVQDGAGGWLWTGTWQTAASLQAGSWNTLVVQVPANASALFELGVQFSLNGTVSGSAYVDSISW
ncbi:MAG TPA: PA14 domain-containing protein [Polyangiaceae bacterium]|nr:PA14 domain-containing protein [Polyangiaceae bacterium]